MSPRWCCIGLPTKKAARQLRAGFAIAKLSDIEIFQFRDHGWFYVKFRRTKCNEAVWAGFVCHWRGGYLLTHDPRERRRSYG